MEKDTCPDGEHVLLIVLVQSPQTLEVENKTRKQNRLFGAGRRGIAWIRKWLRGWIGRLHKYWGLLYSRGKPVCRFVYTRWIVADLWGVANPVLVGGIGFVLPLLAYAALIYAATYRVEPGDYLSFFVESAESVGESWRGEVCRHLLGGNSSKPCVPTQSPVGDYLALEIIVLFIANFSQSLLSRISDPLQKVGRDRLAVFARGVGVAIIVTTNFALTILMSYGFLWPLPRETSTRVFYVGLAVFMLAIGVLHPLAKVYTTFPVRPKLIRDAIIQYQKEASSMAKKAQWRRIALREKICRNEELLSSIEFGKPDRKSILIRAQNHLRSYSLCLKVKIGRFRVAEPKHSLGCQVAGALLIRSCIVLLVGVLAWSRHYMHQATPIVVAVAVWGTLLLVFGAINSAFIMAGAFRFKTKIGKLSSSVLVIFELLLLTSALVTIEEDVRARTYFESLSHLKLTVGLSVFLLIILEVLFVLLAFEFRDPVLTDYVREGRRNNFVADLLREYLRRKWKRETAVLRSLSNKGGRRSSWPPSRSPRSFARRAVQGRSVRMRRDR